VPSPLRVLDGQLGKADEATEADLFEYDDGLGAFVYQVLKRSVQCQPYHRTRGRAAQGRRLDADALFEIDGRMHCAS